MADVVMVSGGLDSFLARSLLPGATPLFVEWGQPYLEMERQAVRTLYPDARTVAVGGLPEPQGQDPYVPARNLMFACMGARFGSRVWLAGMRDEMCADKSPEAFRAMTQILSAHCRGGVEVCSPFWNLTKPEAVRAYLLNGGDREALRKTVSCYGSGSSPCLDCEACFRRFVALVSNGVEVPRPSESVIRSYGLQRIHSVPAATAHATLAALHRSGTPVTAVDIHDLESPQPPSSGVRIVYSRGRGVAPDILQRALAAHGVRFDGVLTGVGKSFFRF